MTDLTRPARDLLGTLQFRDDLGTSYLVQAGYGREALVVPEMTTTRSLSRLSAYNYDTIRQLRDAGLIEVDNESTRIEFTGRKRLDQNWCATAIRLTDAGRSEPTSANARAARRG
jgi:hypothetical protein